MLTKMNEIEKILMESSMSQASFDNSSQIMMIGSSIADKTSKIRANKTKYLSKEPSTA